MEQVVLVDEQDREIGAMEKMEAHRVGKLHRAFSVLVFNSKGESLIQQRAASKYHSAGLWTNACCSHPRPGESIQSAARRRLQEEMGIQADPTFAYKFIYRIQLDDQLTEHEFDHVFKATYDGAPVMDPAEVQNWKFVAIDELLKDVARSPQKYTYWFRLILRREYPELAKHL